MTESALQLDNPLFTLNRTFLLNFPSRAARKIETMNAEDAADIMERQPTYILLPVFTSIAPGVMDAILLKLSESKTKEILMAMDSGPCAALLSRLEDPEQERLLNLLEAPVAKELKELLAYPEETAGRLMNTRVTAFNKDITVYDAIAQLKNLNIEELHHLFLLDDEMRLNSQVDIQKLVLADVDRKLSSLAKPIQAHATVLDPKDEIIEKLKTLSWKISL